jgi:dihydrodipicolinate synthase/N-acetylneuraminate lyase
MLPWTTNWQLDTRAFEDHIESTIADGPDGVYLMGTAGEGYAVDDATFQDVVRRFAALTVGRVRDPQVGVIALSMAQVCERIAFGRDQGIGMFQISLPSWGTLDPDETMLFFETVCGRFPDCRFLHYNLPRVGRVLDGAEYRRIADAVPNLVATKNSTNDYRRTVDLMTHAPDLQHFLLERNFALGCTVGECSLLCSLGVVFPKTAKRLFAAGTAGELETALAITNRLLDVCTDFVQCSPRTLIDGAYDKMFVWLRNPAFPATVLPPYIAMSADELAACRYYYETACGDLD